MAPLPGIAGVPARPFNVIFVFILGRHSSQAQSQTASNFISFMLSRYGQRRLMRGDNAVMPVNDDVLVPVKSSTTIRALDQSVKNSWTSPPSSAGISQVLDRQMTDTIQSVIFGTTSAQEAATQFLDHRGQEE